MVAVLALVFIGPDDLPKMMRLAGRYYAKIRRASDELRRAFNTEVAKVEAEERREEMRRRREEMEKRRSELQAKLAAQKAAAENTANPEATAPAEEAAVPRPPRTLETNELPNSPDDSPQATEAAMAALAAAGVELNEEEMMLPPDPRLPPDAAPRMVRISKE